MRRNPTTEIETTQSEDITSLLGEAFEKGVEVGQGLSGGSFGERVDVVENPRRKRNSIFLTPAVMQQLGRSGIGRMLTKASNPQSVDDFKRAALKAGEQSNLSPTKLAQMAQYRAGLAIRDGLTGYTKSGLASIFKKAYNSAYSFRPNRPNPESTSAEVYAEFHGKPSEQLTEFVYEEHEHENLAQLGELISLTVVTTTGYEATIQAPPLDGPITEVVQLCSTEDKTQLYLIGGDQCIDIESLGFKGAAIKDLMVIGTLEQIEYCTEKSFHKFKPVDYYHQLGEETGVTPVLLYDPISKLMKIAGGEYEIKDVGIVN